MKPKRLAIVAGVLLAVMAAALLAAPAVMAQATDTPTPTDTVTPTLGWTETPWPRATPTPWGLTPVAAIEQLDISDSQALEAVDTIINAYNFVNQNGVVDFIIFVAMSGMVFLMLMRLIRSVKKQA